MSKLAPRDTNMPRFYAPRWGWMTDKDAGKGDIIEPMPAAPEDGAKAREAALPFKNARKER